MLHPRYRLSFTWKLIRWKKGWPQASIELGPKRIELLGESEKRHLAMGYILMGESVESPLPLCG
jgi:hypothetical protein